jgi:hypothetical protein
LHRSLPFGYAESFKIAIHQHGCRSVSLPLCRVCLLLVCGVSLLLPLFLRNGNRFSRSFSACLFLLAVSLSYQNGSRSLSFPLCHVCLASCLCLSPDVPFCVSPSLSLLVSLSLLFSLLSVFFFCLSLCVSVSISLFLSRLLAVRGV